MSIDKRIYELPLFVSYPRTGSHWVNCVMELYFDRPRLREVRATFLSKERTDWMWFHDHDMDMDIQHENAIYLFRNPIDTIFSNIMHDFYAQLKVPIPARFVDWGVVFSERVVRRISLEYRNHLMKWLLSDNKAKVFITYEDFQKDPSKSFKVICEFFNEEFDEHRMQEAFVRVTKKEIVKRGVSRGATGGHLLKSAYKWRRQWFKTTWGDLVVSLVITPELKEYFDRP